MNRLRRLAVLGGLLAVALASPAAWGATPMPQPATRWFSDARGDVPTSVDIERVLVSNDPARPVVVVVEQRRLLAGDGLVVWIDTDPKDDAPEYYAGGIANSDLLGIRAVDTWSAEGTWVDCPRFRMRADQFSPGNRAVLSIPRGCLGDPGRVRVSVLTLRANPDGTATRDVAPDQNRFYAWVPR